MKLGRSGLSQQDPLLRRRPLFAPVAAPGPVIVGAIATIVNVSQSAKTSSRVSYAGCTGGARSNDGGACSISNIRGRAPGVYVRSGSATKEGREEFGNRHCIPGNEQVHDPAIFGCVPVEMSSGLRAEALPSIKSSSTGSSLHVPVVEIGLDSLVSRSS